LGFKVCFLVLGFAVPVVQVVAGDLAEVDGPSVEVFCIWVAVGSDWLAGSIRFRQYDWVTGGMSVAGMVADEEMSWTGFGVTVAGRILLLLLVRA